MTNTWLEIILRDESPAEIWKDIFARMKETALAVDSSAKLHAETVEPDRLLSEAAWELWETFHQTVERTASRIASWTGEAGSTGGKAVLVLDALSLRELFVIVEAAKNRGLPIAHIGVTGSECPSSTDAFAHALGAPSRASLADDKKSAAFIPFAGNCHTLVSGMPFEDCAVPPSPNLFMWHSWLDDLIHSGNMLPDVLEKTVRERLQSDGFWAFIHTLRKGRTLLITSDHGYAVSRNFSSEVQDPSAVHYLKMDFGARRFCNGSAEWPIKTIPPMGLIANNHRVITGQKKWKIQGGFPHICHGGLTLLEALVPWIEMEAL